jgi:tetratricopeptide (TPR) repeat protein
MATKSKKLKENQKHNEQAKIEVATKDTSSRSKWLIILGIIALTFIAYLPGFSPEKEFTNWDDLGYVVDQPLVKTSNPDSLKLLFEPTTQVMLNYHPLTMLTLAYNYSNAELDIQPYFKTNLFLHLLNTFLVFLLLFKWSKSSLYIAGFGALIFGIHPMHVESVAWISERKDVLYTFFFLLSLLSYLRYIDRQKIAWLFIAFVLFIASCLSKAMAVPLPLVFLLVDFLYKRKFTIAVILEKIPFLALSIWFGLNAVKIQSAGAIAEFEVFTLFERIMFASYGFLMYWLKFFVPTNLSAFYPYPTFGEDKALPLIYVLAPFIVLLLILAPLVYFYKKQKSNLRIFLFGMGFFVLMIALVLQFISVGSAIMADRYAYIPYIGGSFMLLAFAFNYQEKLKNKLVIPAILAIYCLFLFVQNYKQVAVWTNSETLWSNVIEQYPFVIEQEGNKVFVRTNGVEVAHKNRGNYYREHGRMDLAFKDYDILVRARVKDPLVYSNMANMYALEGKFQESIDMYKMALERDSSTFDVYVNRGITYTKMAQRANAIKDFKKALTIQPKNQMALSNLCSELVNSSNFNEALIYSNKLIKLYPASYDGYFYRGTANVNLGNHTSALEDLNQSIKLNPNYMYVWFNASVSYKAIGETKKALEYALKAKELGMEVNPAYLESLKN